MVHRAVLGSVERMMAVLAEHYAVIDDQQQPKLPQLKSGCKIEAVGAKWPFWLSPRQAMVIVVDATCSRQIEYAQAVACRLNGRWQGGGEEDSLSSKSRRNNYFYVDVDSDKNSTLNKRIRDALLAQYNYILVVGDSEVDQVRVSLRKNVGKGGGGNKSMTLEEVIDLFVSEIPQGA